MLNHSCVFSFWDENMIHENAKNGLENPKKMMMPLLLDNIFFWFPFPTSLLCNASGILVKKHFSCNIRQKKSTVIFNRIERVFKGLSISGLLYLSHSSWISRIQMLFLKPLLLCPFFIRRSTCPYSLSWAKTFSCASLLLDYPDVLDKIREKKKMIDFESGIHSSREKRLHFPEPALGVSFHSWLYSLCMQNMSWKWSFVAVLGGSF